MKQALLSICAAALGLAMAGQASAASTLETVKARGKLVCGVSLATPGFAAPDDKGRMQGFDVDICRSIAAAVFGDGDAGAATRLAGLAPAEFLERDHRHPQRRPGDQSAEPAGRGTLAHRRCVADDLGDAAAGHDEAQLTQRDQLAIDLVDGAAGCRLAVHVRTAATGGAPLPAARAPGKACRGSR